MGGLLALARGIDRLNAMIGKAVSWLILLAVLISAGNAIIRKMFSTSSNMWLELQWYLYGAAFLGAAAYTLLENEHIRIDIVYGAWSRRVQHWIDLIGHLLFLMPFTLVMLYFLFPYVIRSFERGEVSASAGGLILWPAKGLLLVGFILLFLQGISEIIKKIAVMRGLIEDPHELKSHHAPLEIDDSLRAGAGFADTDHPLTDPDAGHPPERNDNRGTRS
ncbi:TRAP transporter small permease subunit [Paracoccus aerodenitrificans]|uniref:TRAP transporter small permease subunit n=1 Tax=Paracoccus aerodenitrificans TaxID=3017781 RepID=UPI0022F04095|nr:TRAP transporter small permease subunit [Paracoccus aerodenitrificans]WBU65183.1 TRAP transporter small permease subunit [Paracoccus aerodenitrificans]